MQQSITAVYPGNDVAKIITRRTDQQTLRARQTSQLLTYTSNFLKKTENQRIYVYDGGVARTPFVLR